MVTAVVEVGVEKPLGMADAQAWRYPGPTAAIGASFGAPELTITLASGSAYGLRPSDEYRGAGFRLDPGLRAAWRFDLGPLAVRPGLWVAWEHHELDAEWLDEDDARVARNGASASGGCDVIVPFDAGGWLYATTAIGWSTLDGAALARFGVGLGVTIGRSDRGGA